MPDVALPEIQRTSMAGAVLQIKALQLDLDVLTFDFLDRPDQVGEGGKGWMDSVGRGELDFMPNRPDEEDLGGGKGGGGGVHCMQCCTGAGGGGA